MLGLSLAGAIRARTVAESIEFVDPEPEARSRAAALDLRAEAREKLSQIRPANLAQAGRISGITPADLAVLMVHLEEPRP